MYKAHLAIRFGAISMVKQGISTVLGVTATGYNQIYNSRPGGLAMQNAGACDYCMGFKLK